MNQLLLASALLAFSAAASAQSSTTPAAAAPEHARDHHAAAQDEVFADRFCLRQTGSRIVATRKLQSKDDARECVAGNGRVYTRADLDSTGAIDLADALRRLDPAIR